MSEFLIQSPIGLHRGANGWLVPDKPTVGSTVEQKLLVADSKYTHTLLLRPIRARAVCQQAYHALDFGTNLSISINPSRLVKTL